MVDFDILTGCGFKGDGEFNIIQHDVISAGVLDIEHEAKGHGSAGRKIRPGEITLNFDPLQR